MVAALPKYVFVPANTHRLTPSYPPPPPPPTTHPEPPHSHLPPATPPPPLSPAAHHLTPPANVRVKGSAKCCHSRRAILQHTFLALWHCCWCCRYICKGRVVLLRVAYIIRTAVSLYVCLLFSPEQCVLHCDCSKRWTEPKTEAGLRTWCAHISSCVLHLDVLSYLHTKEALSFQLVSHFNSSDANEEQKKVGSWRTWHFCHTDIQDYFIIALIREIRLVTKRIQLRNNSDNNISVVSGQILALFSDVTDTTGHKMAPPTVVFSRRQSNVIFNTELVEKLSQ